MPQTFGQPQLAADRWIVEGVMTTVAPEPADAAPEQRLNVAPMGPIVDAAFSRFILRPFKTSTTYKNLKATGQGVFHITDDVLLIARGAVRKIDARALALLPAKSVEGLVLAEACRYHELRVVSLDDSADRTRIECQAVQSETLRDFFGFNRARHAVLEAAILATRIHLTGVQHVLDAFDPLQAIIDKTGSETEHQAMRELWTYVQDKHESPDADAAGGEA